MSATVDCSLFSNYFSILVNGRQEGAPVIRVDGKMFDVREYYFEDISGLSEVGLSIGRWCNSEKKGEKLIMLALHRVFLTYPTYLYLKKKTILITRSG